MPVPRRSPLLFRRLAIGAVGGGIFFIGLLLFPLPIPLGIVLVPTGLLILATEFQFAKKALSFIKKRTGRFGRKVEAAEGKAVALVNKAFAGKRVN